MTDRQLLELAAKAAGLEVIKHCQEARDKAGYGHVGLYVKSNQGELISTGWNPLTDDDHALRLAVNLRIDVQHWDGPERISAEHPDLPINSITLEVEGDAMTICRRVITRAAAEIGRAMP